MRASGYAASVRTSISARGAAPPERTWERYADLDRWPEWAPQISGVSAGERRLRPGLCGTVRAAGVVHVPFEVLAVDEARRTWSWRVAIGPIRLRLEHGVEDDRGGGTRTWLVTEGPALAVLPYTPLALVALHSLVMDR